MPAIPRSNYGDLTRHGPPKGSVLEGKWDPGYFREIYSRLVKYYNFPSISMVIPGTPNNGTPRFGKQFQGHLLQVVLVLIPVLCVAGYAE